MVGHELTSRLCALQAFYLARTGRPGPVLVDVPKDIQQQLAVPDWDAPMAIAGYMSRLPPPPEESQVAAVVQALHEVGGKRGLYGLGLFVRRPHQARHTLAGLEVVPGLDCTGVSFHTLRPSWSCAMCREHAGLLKNDVRGRLYSQTEQSLPFEHPASEHCCR